MSAIYHMSYRTELLAFFIISILFHSVHGQYKHVEVGIEKKKFPLYRRYIRE